MELFSIRESKIVIMYQKFKIDLHVLTKHIQQYIGTVNCYIECTYRHLNKGNEKLKLNSTFNTLLQKLQN